MNKLTRESILSSKDMVTEVVQVPEWGGSVMVRGMNGAERDLYEKSILVQNGKNTRVNMVNARAKLAVWTVVDEDGKRLFSDADIEALGQKNAASLSRIFNVAARLSGITDEDMAEITKEMADNSFTDSPSV